MTGALIKHCVRAALNNKHLFLFIYLFIYLFILFICLFVFFFLFSMGKML